MDYKKKGHRPLIYTARMVNYTFRLPLHLLEMLGEKERSKRLREILEQYYKKKDC